MSGSETSDSSHTAEIIGLEDPAMNEYESETSNVYHTAEIIGGIAPLCMSTKMSDVTFVVEGEKLPAHRLILGCQSKYFRAMLCGGLWSEATQNEIELKEVPLAAFKIVLRYIYSGRMWLGRMDEGDLFDTLKLANMYGLTYLVNAIIEYLAEIMNVGNVFKCLEIASWDSGKLANVCNNFLDDNSEGIIKHETFISLSPGTLSCILAKDKFYAPEVDIFRAVLDWYKHNQGCPGADDVFAKIRYSLMTEEELLNEVRPSGVLSEEDLQKVITEKATFVKLPYRYKRWPSQNVVCEVLKGEHPSALLEEDKTSSPDDPKSHATWHEIGDSQGIVVKLDKMYEINLIKLLLSDVGGRSYSYYVEVSADQRIWDRVVDYREYLCRSWQFLHFSKRLVRYIRLVGTLSTVDQQFYVVKLEVRNTWNCDPIVDGILEPSHNVATLQFGAAQIEGHLLEDEVGQPLLDGTIEDYNSYSGFVYHQIDGDEKLVIQLGQPYRIKSLNLLLLDCDDRSFSFYIETSTNRKDWVMLADKRDGLHRSWQYFTFEPRVVVFIRLVGTLDTSEEEEFQCVHLECPAQREPPFDWGTMWDEWMAKRSREDDTI